MVASLRRTSLSSSCSTATSGTGSGNVSADAADADGLASAGSSRARVPLRRDFFDPATDPLCDPPRLWLSSNSSASHHSSLSPSGMRAMSRLIFSKFTAGFAKMAWSSLAASVERVVLADEFDTSELESPAAERRVDRRDRADSDWGALEGRVLMLPSSDGGRVLCDPVGSRQLPPDVSESGLTSSTWSATNRWSHWWSVAQLCA